MFARISSFIVLVFGMAGAAKAQSIPDKPLFTIAGKPVSAAEFIYLYRKNHQNKPATVTEADIKEYLQLFINFKLKVAEAQAQGLDTTQAFVKEFATYRDELKKPFLARADELDKLTREAYQRLTEEVKAAHILITVSPEASPADTLEAFQRIVNLHQRILAGEDFEGLARQFSEEPNAQNTGGQLGYFTALQMVFPFEDAAYKLQVGEVSKPVRTRFGYHLIKVYDRQPARGEVEVSHILLRGTDLTTRNKIFEVYDQWKAGRQWEELCREYSEDASTRESGGKLRPFGVGALASIPEFERVAFGLREPGEVSDPFSSAVGWHLVRLEKKIAMPPYSELEASLKRRVARDERLQISKTANLARRKREAGFAESANASQLFTIFMDTLLVAGKWVEPKQLDRGSQVIFTIGKQQATLAQLARFVQRQQRPSTLSPQGAFQVLYDMFVEEKLDDYEDDELMASNPEYRNLLTEYREGILLFSIMEREVWNKASADTAGQRSYYEANQSRYTAGERVEARLLATADDTYRQAIKEKIKRGDTLKADELRALKVAQALRGYARGESKPVDQVLWVAGLHETEANNLFYLVEVTRLLPAGSKSFNEARAAVIADYQDACEKQWIAQLQKKYPVQVNKKVQKFVVRELIQKP